MKYFIKTAYNLKNANKIINIFKSKQIPIEKSIMTDLYFYGKTVGAMPKSKNLRKILKQTNTSELSLAFPYSIGLVPGKTFDTTKGKLLETTLKQLPKVNIKVNNPNFTARNKKYIDSIIRGHELDEMSAKPVRGFFTKDKRFTHTSPEVILREHNRVTTLPKTEKNVKKFFNELRATSSGKTRGEEEIIQKIYPGYIHGVSPRISRHTRKNIVKKLQEIK